MEYDGGFTLPEPIKRGYDTISKWNWGMVGAIASIVSMVLGFVIIGMLNKAAKEGLVVILTTWYYPLYYVGYSLIGCGLLGLPISSYFWDDEYLIWKYP